MIVPSTRIFTAGEVETGAYLNSAVTNLGNFMLGRPIAILRQTAAQSIPNATATDITFDAEDIDRDGGHSLTTNTARYTAATAGWYWVQGAVSWAANTTGNRTASINKNGTSLNYAANRNASALLANIFTQPVAGLVYLNGTTDYITLSGTQSSGAALNTATTAGYQSYLSVVWVSL